MEKKQIVEIKVNPVFSKIETKISQEAKDALYSMLSFEVPGFEFMINPDSGWDGKKRLFNKITCTFLTGLLFKVRELLQKDFEYNIKIKWNLIKPEKTLFYDWNENFKLRDYQIEIVETCIRKKRAVISATTGSGKTLMVAKLIQELGVSPTIFYVLTRDLLYQAQEVLEKTIPGLRVGIIGDGVCQISDINVMTVQTAYMAFKVKKDKRDYLAMGMSKKEFNEKMKENLNHVKKNSEKIKNLVKNANFIYADECLVEGTRVLNANGGIVKIENVQNGDNLIGGRVSNKFSRSVKEIIHLTHQCATLSTTRNHPNLCVLKKDLRISKKHSTYGNIEKVVEEDVKTRISRSLKIGDFLLVPKKIKHIMPKNNNLTYNQLRLISTIMCDGHIENFNYRVKINIDKDREWFKEVFISGLKDFNVKDYSIKEDCRKNLLLHTNNRKFNSFLVDTVGIKRGKKSKYIYISDFLWNNKLKNLKGFVDGCFCSEGDVSKNRIVYTTTSPRMCKDLQLLLLKYGVISQIKTKKRKHLNKKHNDVFYLSITGDSINDFNKKIKLSMNRKDVHIRSFKNSRKRYVEYKGNTYFLSKIKKIEEEKGIFTVYDFETEKHHFIAENTLTHNCHHFSAASCKKIISKSTEAYYRFSGSATPVRMDNSYLIIEGLFGRKTVEVTASDLIKKGYLLKPKIRFIKLNSDREICYTYPEDYTKHIVENDERNKCIVKLAVDAVQRGLKTMVLIRIIEHGETLKADLEEKLGREVPFIYGGTKKKLRTRSIKDLDSGKNNIVVASTICDEGLDIPSLSCLILASGGKSPTRAKQRVGRVIRLGSPYAEVYDFLDIGRWTSKHSYARIKILKEESEFDIKKINITEIMKNTENLF